MEDDLVERIKKERRRTRSADVYFISVRTPPERCGDNYWLEFPLYTQIPESVAKDPSLTVKEAIEYAIDPSSIKDPSITQQERTPEEQGLALHLRKMLDGELPKEKGATIQWHTGGRYQPPVGNAWSESFVVDISHYANNKFFRFEDNGVNMQALLLEVYFWRQPRSGNEQ